MSWATRQGHLVLSHRLGQISCSRCGRLRKIWAACETTHRFLFGRGIYGCAGTRSERWSGFEIALHQEEEAEKGLEYRVCLITERSKVYSNVSKERDSVDQGGSPIQIDSTDK